jgi:hypothetical protein
LDPLSVLGPISNVVARILGRRRPALRVTELKSTGGSSDRLTFTAVVANVGTAPALGCVLAADLDGLGDVHRSQPFNMPPDELQHPVRFALERPRYGDLVQQFNHAFTLYGRRLTVRVVVNGNVKARAILEEVSCDPVTDGARFAVQQEVWAKGRPLASASTSPT